MKKTRRRVRTPAPPDEIERARAAAAFLDPADELRQRTALVDQHRGERSDQLARHAQEVAELVARQAAEERHLEHRQQIETGRLRSRQHPGRVGPWLMHQERRGRPS